MTTALSHAVLKSRALISLSGENWRDFLQGLITQDVDTLAPGQARFGALLTPQGRLLFDLFVVGREDGAWLDVQAQSREALILRLTMYRLRAKVTIAADEAPVAALFGEGRAPQDWIADPRLPALGWRGYGAAAPADALEVDETAYDVHRLALGVPGPADWGSEKTYPIEANFDLLHGIDFQKGCFVGQETTSRMKRRGQIKNRMLPLTFDGAPPAFDAEVLTGDRRAGEVLSGQDGRAMALVRLDRIDGELTADGKAVRVDRPAWLPL
ncbi:folate-binding protein YgfZ [Phenylobacterium sp.]|uniref:CAF17-like 4Fe-4S cluster assembly/insertion protein YgfZ n=1 Tax=Phenylobacterium sp. TaxID=1871053 RepID=UPI002716DCE4|nr:folate-binding protein YgfZ [Phenylobacterium sp.]MDO8379921.1 folate-binding protein YgfZ [Phenylobacterium sp.]